jgi:ABC-type antimicrobial peptide transport system permease subunit
MNGAYVLYVLYMMEKIGDMEIMYVSVAERTFEIGLRKSLGAQKKDILWQFLCEAVIITLGGGVVGIIAGALVALLVYFGATAFGLKWIYSVPPQAILLSVSFSALIGLVFGLYPARKAANLSPIDALRQE